MEHTEIELRQEYNDKMHNYRPSWILRWGVSWVFIFFIIIIVISGFIKFPDIVPAQVEITTINPPVHLIGHLNGKIKKVLKKEGELVKSQEAVVLMESPVNWEDVKNFDHQLSLVESAVSKKDKDMLYQPGFFRTDLELGEIQMYYSEFLDAYNELYRFYSLAMHQNEKTAIGKSLHIQKEYNVQLIHKQKLFNDQNEVILDQLHADSVLYNFGGLTKVDLEDSYRRLRQFEATITDINMAIINGDATVKQLEHDMLKVELDEISKKQILFDGVNKSIQLLRSSLENWKQNYILISPIVGKVSFSFFWTENQNVNAGDVVVSIIPEDTIEVKVRIHFPVQNSGKVNIGQRVNIKLDNYPYYEFGMLIGKLQHISKVPNKLMYSGDIILENGLTTSYKKKLPFDQELMGNAEILTDDMSLLVRFFDPIRSLINN